MTLRNPRDNFPHEGRSLLSAMLELRGTNFEEYSSLPEARRKEITSDIKSKFDSPEVKSILETRREDGLLAPTARDLRQALGVEKWTKLSSFVAYLSSLLSQNTESQRRAEYEKHAAVGVDSNAINHRATRLNTLTPASIQEFIIGQSSFHERAFLELITNALDALPNSSARGRFGVGFYQSFSLLEHESHRIEIKTQTAKDRHCNTMQFRNHQGEIEFSSNTSERIAQGTKVVIESAHIDALAATEVIKKHLKYISSAQIILNEAPVNNVSEKDSKPKITIIIRDGHFEVQDPGSGMDEYSLFQNLLYRTASGKPDWASSRQLDKSNASYLFSGIGRETSECNVAILVGEILIDEFKVKGANLPAQLILDLPTSLALTEARDRIVIDEIAIEVLGKLIKDITSNPAPIGIPLANALYPTLIRIESRTDSKLGSANEVENLDLPRLLRAAIQERYREYRVLPNTRDFLNLDCEKLAVQLLNPNLARTSYSELPGAKDCTQFSPGKISRIIQLPFREGARDFILDGTILLLNDKLDLSAQRVLVNQALELIRTNAGQILTDTALKPSAKLEQDWKITAYPSLLDFAQAHWTALGFADSRDAKIASKDIIEGHPELSELFCKNYFNRLPPNCYLDCWDLLEHCTALEFTPDLKRKLLVLSDNVIRILDTPEIQSKLMEFSGSPLRTYKYAFSDLGGHGAVILRACHPQSAYSFKELVESPFNPEESAYLIKLSRGAQLCLTRDGQLLMSKGSPYLVTYNDLIVGPRGLFLADASTSEANILAQLPDFDRNQITLLQKWLSKGRGYIPFKEENPRDSNTSFGRDQDSGHPFQVDERYFASTFDSFLESDRRSTFRPKREDAYLSQVSSTVLEGDGMREPIIVPMLNRTIVAGAFDDGLQVNLFQIPSLAALLDLPCIPLQDQHIKGLSNYFTSTSNSPDLALNALLFTTLQGSHLSPQTLRHFYSNQHSSTLNPRLLSEDCAAILDSVSRRGGVHNFRNILETSSIILGDRTATAPEQVLRRVSDFFLQEFKNDFLGNRGHIFKEKLQESLPKRNGSLIELIRAGYEIPASEIPESMRTFYLWMLPASTRETKSHSRVSQVKADFTLADFSLWSRENSSSYKENFQVSEVFALLGAEVATHASGKSVAHIQREISHTCNFTAQSAFARSIIWLTEKVSGASSEARRVDISSNFPNETTLETTIALDSSFSFSELLKEWANTSSPILTLLQEGVCTFSCPTDFGSLHLEVRPIKRNDLIVDAHVKISSSEEPLTNSQVIFVRTCDHPELQAKSFHSRVIGGLSLVPPTEIQFRFNDQIINRGAEVIATIPATKGNELQVLREIGFQLSSGGIAIRSLTAEDFPFLPDFIFDTVKEENTLVMNLPRSTPLIRSGNEVEDRVQWNDDYRAALHQGAIEAFSRKLIRQINQGKDSFPYELIPYDYFSDSFHAALFQAPQLLAEALRGMRPLDNSISHLTLREPREVLFYLPIFAVEGEYLSLDQLRQRHADAVPPFSDKRYRELLPSQLASKIDFSRGIVPSTNEGDSTPKAFSLEDSRIDALLDCENRDLKKWIIENYQNLLRLHTLTNEFLKLPSLISKGVPVLGFYYAENNSIAHVNRYQNTMAWNLFYLKSDLPNRLTNISELLELGLNGSSDELSKKWFDGFLDSASHEAAHLIEDPLDSTHHSNFQRIQAGVLLSFLVGGGIKRLIEESSDTP